MTSFLDGSTNGPTIAVEFYINGSWVRVNVGDLREVSFTRGRTRADQKNDPGHASIVVDNFSGYYDPEYTLSGSPYVVGGVNQLKAGLKTRIIGTWQGTGYYLFVGFLETSLVDQGFSPTATMTFTDGIALLSKMYALAVSPAGYAGETTSTRVGRMLTYANWTDSRNLSGSVQMEATTQSATLQNIIEQCVACEAGRFFISREGTATFLPLSDKFSRVTRLLLSDSRATNTVEYDVLETTPGTYQVINEALIQRESGTQRRYRHLPSTTAFGLKTITVNAPILNDSDADNLAKYLAYKDHNPQTLVQSVQFSAFALGALYPDLLSLEIGDQVTIERTTVDGRTLELYCVVEGFNHSITPESWRVEINTSPMNPYSITI
jgi:hypothetical protein